MEDQSITFGSADFVAAMKGTIVSSHPPGEHVAAEDVTAGGEEFSNFEDLTRKLVNTPKSEVDEKRRADKDVS